MFLTPSRMGMFKRLLLCIPNQKTSHNNALMVMRNALFNQENNRNGGISPAGIYIEMYYRAYLGQ